MRIVTELVDVSDKVWDHLNNVVKTDYLFPAGSTRVCFTFTRGAEERHVDMPFSVYGGLMQGLSVGEVFGRLGAQIAEAGRVVQAALTPDALPDDVEHYLAQTRDADKASLAAEWERADPEGVANLRRSAAELDGQ